mmetsp:Transcript_60455/g.70714  ORF Transcript_60455/g.70714 Transcript_60455/m.70714 type:complete len:139 (+) Transcript_60455:715-1131(+)
MERSSRKVHWRSCKAIKFYLEEECPIVSLKPMYAYMAYLMGPMVNNRRTTPGGRARMRGRRRREKQERRQNDEQQSYFSSKEIDSVNLDTNLTCEYRYDLYIAISRSCVTQRIIAIRARTEQNTPSRTNDVKQFCACP